MKQSLLEGESYCPENYHIKKKFLTLPQLSTNEKNDNPAETAKQGYLINDTAYLFGLTAFKDHVCSHLRRPHSFPPRGLAFGILKQHRQASDKSSTTIRLPLRAAPTMVRDCVDDASAILRRSSKRNALHSEQPRSAVEAESKPARSGPEHASNKSRSGVE